MQLSVDQHHSVVAVLADVGFAVRDDDHGFVATFAKQLQVAAFGKGAVAHGHDFVNQKTIEVDDHGHGKGQAGHHAVRVALHGLVKIAAQLGKVEHKVEFVAPLDAVNAAHQAQRVAPCERATKATDEGQRPGHAHATANVAAARLFCAANEPNESGFARAVAPQNAQFFAGAHGQVDVLQHGAHAFAHGVLLAHVVQRNHCSMPRWVMSRTWARPNRVSTVLHTST